MSEREREREEIKPIYFYSCILVEVVIRASAFAKKKKSSICSFIYIFWGFQVKKKLLMTKIHTTGPDIPELCCRTG